MGESLSKVKYFFADNKEKLFYAALLVLFSMMSFLLGRLSAIEHKKAEIRTESVFFANIAAGALRNANKSDGERSRTALNEQNERAAQNQKDGNNIGQYVASKNGKSYHLKTCPGAKLIKEENKVFFATEEAAAAKGYAPAKNCKELFERTR